MKGILYSVIAALLLIPIMGLILFHSNLLEKNVDVNIRANELKFFVESLDDDLSRFLEICSKRALISAVSNITVSGMPFEDASVGLSELMINGTIKGISAPLVDESNINLWEKNISDIATKQGFSMAFKGIEINVTQNDSFSIMVNVKILLNISDSSVKMGVLRNLTASKLIPIEGIEDPLIPLNTLGRVSRIIRFYDFSNFTGYIVEGTIASGGVSGNATTSTLSPNSQKILVTDNMTQGISVLNMFGGVVSESTYVPGGIAVPYVAGATGALSIIEEGKRVYLDYQTKKVWDLENLTSFVSNGYYRVSENGPSFLDRLEGNLALSEKYAHGMETIIDLEDLGRMNLEVDYSLSCVDYKYFTNIPGSSIRNGNYDSIFNWLKIDSENKAIYGVEELA